jgi:hypothetical protein
MDPILLVGSPRTGTTALAIGLKAAGIAGFAEGHLLMLLVRVEQAISKYYQDELSNNVSGTLLHSMPMPQVATAYRELARSILDNAHDNKPWFDKTAHGGMVGALPFFQSVWPKAKITFAKRRPLENLQSRLKKFPHMSFAEHCADLKYIYMTWSQVRKQMNNWLEVEQYDLVVKCEPTSKVITDFLNLQSDAATAFYHAISNTQPERSTLSYEPLKFSSLDWHDDKKKIFFSELDEVMTLYNYGYDSYFAA